MNGDPYPRPSKVHSDPPVLRIAEEEPIPLRSVDRHCDAEAHAAFVLGTEVLTGRWKAMILWILQERTCRFGDLSTRLPGITPKVLTEALRDLERAGVVARWSARYGPRRVEYGLTSDGHSLVPALRAIRGWGAKRSGGASTGIR
jgi:DNA-binding HxlR family transcriptional regulator